MAKNMEKSLERAFKEITEFMEEAKPMRVRNNFKQRQLKFLKADVKKPKVPFNIGMRRLEEKKQRRINNIQRKQALGNFFRKSKS